MFSRFTASLFAVAMLVLPFGAQSTADVPLEDLKDHVAGWSASQLTAELDLYQAAIEAELAAIETQTPELEAQIEAEADVEAKAGLTAQVTALAEKRDDLLERFRRLYGPAKAADVKITEYQLFAQDADGAAIDPRDQSAEATVAWLTRTVEKATVWAKEEGPAFAAGWAFKIVLFLGIVLVFKWLGGVLGRIVSRALSSSKVNVSDLLKAFFVGVVKKLMLVFGFVIALGTLGINVGPLLAGLGIVGFVLGFALQDTLSNFAAGVMILFYRPFDVGNVISAGGQTGKVDSMSLVSTTIVTPDNQVHVVPNGAIWGGVITNITKRSTRRVDMVVGVAYDADLNHTMRVLTEVVTGHEKVLDDPEPTIKVSNLGDSSVDFVVRPWSRTEDYWDVKFDLTKAIKERLDDEGIGIPFPQRDVHMIPMAAGGEVLTPASAGSKAAGEPVGASETKG